MLLLSKPETNFKISKNLKLNYNTYSLNHAHSNLSGFNVCPMANKITENENNSKKSNCSSVCVGYNGFASIHNSVMESRIKKTLSYFLDRDSFLQSLIHEIEKAIERGGAILTLKPTKEQMFLSVDDLELAKKTLSNKEFPPRLKWEEKPFRLCNVYWQTKEKTNQMELLDE